MDTIGTEALLQMNTVRTREKVHMIQRVNDKESRKKGETSANA